MSSSARAVRLGRPPGIFLLTKWITCSFSGARAHGGRRPAGLLLAGQAQQIVGRSAAP